MKRWLLLVSALAASWGFVGGGTDGGSPPPSPGTLFEEANEAFYAGEHARALKLYSQMDTQTAAVRYNRARAHFAAGEVGPAMLELERAWLLAPRDPDILAARALLREQFGLAPPELPPLSGWAFAVRLNTWVLLASAGFWGAAALLLLPGLYGRGGVLTRTLAGVAGLVFLLSFAALVLHHTQRNLGVVTQAEAPLKVAPTSASPVAQRLASGEIAYALRTHNEHVEVTLPGERTGWLPAGAFSRVRRDD